MENKQFKEELKWHFVTMLFIVHAYNADISLYLPGIMKYMVYLRHIADTIGTILVHLAFFGKYEF